MTTGTEDGLDLVFQALGNRTRRALLRALRSGPANVGDLAAPHGMSLNAVSKHLMVLERAGLVTRTVAGRTHLCALEAGPMANAEAWLAAYEEFWAGKLDQLTAYIESGQDLT